MTPHTVLLYKLSVTFERNIEQAHTGKRIRYAYMDTDIEDAGFMCKHIPFEVGSRGHITGSNRANLATHTKLPNPKPT